MKELDNGSFFNLPEVHVGHDQFMINKTNLGRQIQLHLGKELDLWTVLKNVYSSEPKDQESNKHNYGIPDALSRQKMDVNGNTWWLH
jgi:hypothetical protein